MSTDTNTNIILNTKMRFGAENCPLRFCCFTAVHENRSHRMQSMTIAQTKKQTNQDQKNHKKPNQKNQKTKTKRTKNNKTKNTIFRKSWSRVLDNNTSRRLPKIVFLVFLVCLVLFFCFFFVLFFWFFWFFGSFGFVFFCFFFWLCFSTTNHCYCELRCSCSFLAFSKCKIAKQILPWRVL